MHDTSADIGQGVKAQGERFGCPQIAQGQGRMQITHGGLDEPVT